MLSIEFRDRLAVIENITGAIVRNISGLSSRLFLAVEQEGYVLIDTVATVGEERIFVARESRRRGRLG